jgi:hypothetical protein
MAYRNDSDNDDSGVDLERNAYNAAFYELGLRWHWDSATFDELRRQGSSEAERIHRYLSAHQPHLLKAYDAGFLVELIQQKQAQHRSRNSGTQASRSFDWSQTNSGELGA